LSTIADNRVRNTKPSISHRTQNVASFCTPNGAKKIPSLPPHGIQHYYAPLWIIPVASGKVNGHQVLAFLHRSVGMAERLLGTIVGEPIVVNGVS
jgi:hypothetical protein